MPFRLEQVIELRDGGLIGDKPLDGVSDAIGGGDRRTGGGLRSTAFNTPYQPPAL